MCGGICRHWRRESGNETMPRKPYSVLNMSSSTARRLVYLVGCGSWLVLAKAAGSPSIDLPEHATEGIKAFDRHCRPIREWSAPPAALLEQPLEVLPSGNQERLGIHAPELT